MADKKADIKTVQEKKGVDFCVSKSHCYIIRSDLGCYMKAKDFNKGSDLSIHALHPCCQHGDHYLADKKGRFYIIKGNEYRRVTDLTEDTDSEVFPLHPKCRGGDHYLSAFGSFYIIFQENNKTENKQGTTENKQGTTENNQGTTENNQGTTENNQGTTENNQGTTENKQGTTENNQGTTENKQGTTENKQMYRITSHLKEKKGCTCVWCDPNPNPDLEPNPLPKIHDSYKDGLYYWGDKKHYYFLKKTKWGFEYHKVKDLSNDEGTAASSVHPDVLNFLPDGLSKTSGPAFGKWVKIKYVSNESPIPVEFQKKVTKKVGYNKEKISQITRSWQITPSGKITAGKLARLIADAEFTLSGVYERSRVNTVKDIWTKETVEEEQLSFKLEENGFLYVWQFQLGFGSEPVWFWRNLKITGTPKRPKEVPITPETSPVPQELQENTKDLKNTNKPNPPPEDPQPPVNTPDQQSRRGLTHVSPVLIETDPALQGAHNRPVKSHSFSQ